MVQDSTAWEPLPNHWCALTGYWSAAQPITRQHSAEIKAGLEIQYILHLEFLCQGMWRQLKNISCKFFYLGNCYVTLYSQYKIMFTATFRNTDYEDLWHGKWKEILVLSIMLCTQSTNNHNCHKNSDKKLSKIQCRDQDELNNLAPSSNVLISTFVCLGGDKSS